MRKLVVTLGVLSLIAVVVGCASMRKAPLKTVDGVDLPRFMGDWYVIANIPYFAERDCVGSIERYALREDGKIDTTFLARKPDFDGKEIKVKSLATVVDHETNAEWKVSFFGIVRFSYLILDLAPDYSYAVVGHPSRNYAWVLARTPMLDDAVYEGILERLAAQGYDPSRLKKVPQRMAE